MTLIELVHTQGRLLPAHGHANPYLALLVSGSYEDIAAGRRRTFAPADALFSPAGFEHRDRIGTGGARFLVVTLDGDGGDRFVERRAAWSTPGHWRGGGPALDLARLHLELVRSGGTLDAWQVESRLLAAWARVDHETGGERGRAPWLERARARLHDESAALPRVIDLAADAGVHPTYFARAFARHYGLGPAQYRAHLRVTAACRALAERATLREIAIAVGYADQAHFARDFLRRMGTTPARYRRLILRPTAVP